jgi:hypothetical protein
VIEIYAWLVFVGTLLLIGTVAGIYFGERIAKHRSRSLAEREAKLQAEWNSLLTAQRLNATFMEARKAMWEEAIRQHRGSTPQ